jgi:hypothetical protein
MPAYRPRPDLQVSRGLVHTLVELGVGPGQRLVAAHHAPQLALHVQQLGSLASHLHPGGGGAVSRG